MVAVRLAIAALLLALAPAAAALAQDGADDPDSDKVSNERPDRPLQMPPASGEVKEAFDDFERFSRRGAWERALKVLDGIPRDQARRFVDGVDGFIIPVERKRRAVLAALPPEGQAAYRLFYDDPAKKLLAEAEGASEQETLERIVSAYFPTSVGDDAADRLGDLYFELGRFDRAADCWLAVLRDRPDTDLSPALLATKAALALARAGRRFELEELRREVADRYAEERVTLGGRTATPAEHLTDLLDAASPSVGGSASDADGPVAGPGPDLAGPIPAAWQLRFAESVRAGMSPQELTQWQSNPLSAAVPAVAVAGGRLFANYLGHVVALDLDTGKLLWRSASFHNIEIPAQQDQARMIDPSRYAILASDRYVWSMVRDLTDQNQMAPFRLSCRRAEGGELVWQTTDLPEYAELDLVGKPILGGDALFVAAKLPLQRQQGPHPQHLLAIRPRDGKLLWKAEVGTFRQGRMYFYYGMGDTTPQPKLAYHNGAVYIDTHAGVLARVDAETGSVEWGYGYKTDPSESQGRFFIFFGGDSSTPDPESSSSVPIRSGPALFVKGAKSDRIAAIDPDRMVRLWERPLAKSARLLGADDRRIYLGGPEVCALDRGGKDLLWATRLPGGSSTARLLVRPGGLWQLTPRGVFELDPETGRVRRIFRGDDTGSDGGDLLLTDRWLLAVTERTISAYPKAAAAAGAAVGPGAGAATTTTRGSDD